MNDHVIRSCYPLKGREGTAGDGMGGGLEAGGEGEKWREEQEEILLREKKSILSRLLLFWFCGSFEVNLEVFFCGWCWGKAFSKRACLERSQGSIHAWLPQFGTEAQLFVFNYLLQQQCDWVELFASENRDFFFLVQFLPDLNLSQKTFLLPCLLSDSCKAGLLVIRKHLSEMKVFTNSPTNNSYVMKQCQNLCKNFLNPFSASLLTPFNLNTTFQLGVAICTTEQRIL